MRIENERLALLEANARRKRRASVANVTNNTTTNTDGQLTILDTPVVLSTATGGLAWTTQSGTWPSSATHVYLSVQQGVGPGLFEVRKSSSSTAYAICGALSASVGSDRTVGTGFVALTNSSTFDWRNVANTAYTLTLVGYIS